MANKDFLNRAQSIDDIQQNLLKFTKILNFWPSKDTVDYQKASHWVIEKILTTRIPDKKNSYFESVKNSSISTKED